MATSISEISQMLEALDINFQRNQGGIMMDWGTKVYRNYEGEKNLQIAIVLPKEQEGRQVKIAAPLAFTLEDGDSKAFFEACCRIQRRDTLIRFEYDSAHGDVHLSIVLPIGTARFTPEQLVTYIKGMLNLIDHFYPTLDQARRTGQIQFPEL